MVALIRPATSRSSQHPTHSLTLGATSTDVARSSRRRCFIQAAQIQETESTEEMQTREAIRQNGSTRSTSPPPLICLVRSDQIRRQGLGGAAMFHRQPEDSCSPRPLPLAPLWQRCRKSRSTSCVGHGHSNRCQCPCLFFVLFAFPVFGHHDHQQDCHHNLRAARKCNCCRKLSGLFRPLSRLSHLAFLLAQFALLPSGFSFLLAHIAFLLAQFA